MSDTYAVFVGEETKPLARGLDRLTAEVLADSFVSNGKHASIQKEEPKEVESNAGSCKT